MKTFLTHSISMAMVPISLNEQPLEQFMWQFQVIPPEQVFSLIRVACTHGTFANCISLAMMDSIIKDQAERYGTCLPTPDGRGHVKLEEGDTLIVIRYSGRKLTPRDRTLPTDTKLTYYKMEMGVSRLPTPTWQEELAQEGDIACAKLVDNL